MTSSSSVLFAGAIQTRVLRTGEGFLFVIVVVVEVDICEADRASDTENLNNDDDTLWKTSF